MGLGPLSCGPSTFGCSSDAQCLAAGADGMCQLSGFCSFPDGECASGQRYGEHAGELANKCAPPTTGDTDNSGATGDGTGDGTDGPDPDGPDPDGPDPDGPDDDDDDDDAPDDTATGDDDDDAETGLPSDGGSGSSADSGGGVTNTYDPCGDACDGFCAGINEGEVCTLLCDVDAQDCPALAVLRDGDYALTCMSFFAEGICGVPCEVDTDCPADTTCGDLLGEGICLYEAPAG